MRRRLVASYLVIAVFVLVSLEVPLGIVAANRERDSVRSVAERDAAILSAIALRDFHADDHGASKVDLAELVRRYESGTGAAGVVVDRSGS
ncbi:MAG: sensor histidine kinase, partial [Actinobacteria bacterium]|nr:sensor histidine kinase [Actinomycetota bacterium]